MYVNICISNSYHSQDECKWQFHNACYRSTAQREKIKYNLGD